MGIGISGFIEIDAESANTDDKESYKTSKRKELKLIRPTMMYQEAKRRYDELIGIKLEKEKALEKAPPEKIHVIKTSKRVQYYLRKDAAERTGEYIPKSETEVIRKYIQKSYDEKVLKQINVELKNLESYLKKSDQIIEKIRQFYSDNPDEIKDYIIPVDVSDEDYAVFWQRIPFDGKEIPDYVPFLETKRKERVRSKSELNIANMLDKHGIPYKYECPIMLSNGKMVYPDFTVLNVKERKEYYWEHRGMMDDKEYARQAVFKAKSFLRNGIVAGKNLIITEETSTNPLGTDEIEMIIQQFFKS